MFKLQLLAIVTLMFTIQAEGGRLRRQSYDSIPETSVVLSDYVGSLAPTDQPTRIINLRSNPIIHQSVDPLCTNEAIKSIILSNIHDDLDRSRQAIEVSLNDKYEGKIWIVACSYDVMSTTRNKKVYCQTSRSGTWCSAYAL